MEPVDAMFALCSTMPSHLREQRRPGYSRKNLMISAEASGPWASV